MKVGLVEVDQETGSHPYYSISPLGRDLLKGKIDITDVYADDLD